MKNNEKLLDIIGEADEQLIPELSARKKPSAARWLAVGGGVCAAALMGAIALHGVGRPAVPITSGSTSEAVSDGALEVSSAVQESAEPPAQTTGVTTADTQEAQPTESDDRFVMTDEEYERVLSEHRIYPEYELPELTDDGLQQVSPKQLDAGGFGIPAIMVYDLSEWDAPNPWTEELQLESLPVFLNLSYIERTGGASVYLSEEQMLTMAENTAAVLGLAVNSTESTTIDDIMGNPPEQYADSVYRVLAQCSGATIAVEGDGEITIEFDEPVKLPDGYSFTYSGTDDEQGEKTIAYLADRLRGLIQYDAPVTYSYNDRNIRKEQSRSYYVYDSSDDIVQDILNYNMKWTALYPDDNGELYFIRMCNAFVSADYLGDYPLISADEARAQALSEWNTDESNIAKVELIYRTGDKYIMPYYRFYFDITENSQLDAERLGDMREYYLYLVPAVAPEYLSDMSSEDKIIK